MALLPQPNLNLTDKDFASVRARLESLVRSAFPEWTDFNVASFGNILLELFAFVADALFFYLDAQGQESRLVTATQRKNVIALARMLGYEAATARAATADVQVTLSRVPAADVTIAAGRKLTTSAVTPALSFYLLADIVIPAGTNPPVGTGIVENAETAQESFQASGLADQEIVLGRTPFIDETSTIVATNGAFTEVDNFLDSTSTDRHYTVVIDQDDRATVRFGNGVNGAIPVGQVQVAYKIGGGARGNVDPGKITRIDGAVVDALGAPIGASATNSTSASGGADRQTLAQIKTLAPLSLRTITRTVAREDFEINAMRVAGVARALMLTSNEDAGVQENTGTLYVVPSGGGVPTQVLKDAVLEMVTVTYPSTLTFRTFVSNPVYLTVDVTSRVFLRHGYTAATVRQAIIDALTDHFAVSLDDGTPNPNVDFGFNFKDADGNPAGEIAWSDVFDVIRDVAGVRKVDDGPDGLMMNGAREDLTIPINAFPMVGEIVLLNGDTGGAL